MLPLRLNDRDRDRNKSTKRKSSSTATASSSSSSKTNLRHHRSSHGRSTRHSTKDRDPDLPARSSSTLSTSTVPSSRKRRFSMPGVDDGRDVTASFLESRTSLPYPSFSKAHSREAVGKPGGNIPTPDPTDLTEDANKSNHPRENHHAPPSPPLTSVDQQSSRKGSTVGDKENEKKETGDKLKDGKTKIRIRAESTRSSSSLRSKKDDTKSTSTTKPLRPETPPRSFKSPSQEKDTPSRTTSHKTPKTKEDVKPKRSSTHAMSPPRSSVMGNESANGSDATIAPGQTSTPFRKPKSPEKPPSRTQMRSSMSQSQSSRRGTPVDAAYEYGRPPTAQSGFGAPPPPPPPPEVPASIPRVDYLLQHGGLDRRLSKTLFMTAGGDPAVPGTQPQMAAGRVFDPFHKLLDDYSKVMSKSGSLAVATGYRSVARRLLDRLEAVFARDISCESCRCLICDRDEIEERQPGVSWGEVLELVSGRRELPAWPPFVMDPSVADPGLSSEEHIPMQKMDIDVPEEYREHYIRQSRKTKLSVDKWLSEQQVTSAPVEVDDETLTFAMLTHLGHEQRPIFCALLGISSATPTPRPDGQPRAKPQALVSSSLAIQRLYRLGSLPRDPETAIYMLNNPGIHHVLATLSAISDDEWEILISGRFDGFLRSGAEDAIPPLAGSTPSRFGSRSNTPFTPGSRGPTPSMDGSYRPSSQPYGPGSSAASFGGPIALDEETEIAALAEIERDIYLGMEALEDAFEALHCKAEVVRRALRERGAGLSVATQNRRGSFVEARLGTPSSGLGNPWDSGDDDFLDDVQSLAPDDSASNISSNRRRRPKRRTERRTPAPVEEEDEEEDRYESRRDRDSRGSRRR